VHRRGQNTEIPNPLIKLDIAVSRRQEINLARQCAAQSSESRPSLPHGPTASCRKDRVGYFLQFHLLATPHHFYD
jgi:hypothetical protein